MHQFTYFFGEVNFYYRGKDGEKKVAVMNTGDTMYITPFVPHTFTTRVGAKENGLILALTYGNKLTGDVQQELSALKADLGSEFALDFSNKNKSSASLLKFNREVSSMGLNELSKRTEIPIEKLTKFENGDDIPLEQDYQKIASVLNVNSRDLMPNDEIQDKVLIQKYEDAKRWYFPEDTQAYEIVELTSAKYLPFSKAYEFNILKNEGKEVDLKVGLHQYGYNVGSTDIEINWNLSGKSFNRKLHLGDSFYIKPFVPHNFRGNGKVLILRVGGKVAGESQRELSFVGKESVHRAISETMQWFDT